MWKNLRQASAKKIKVEMLEKMHAEITKHPEATHPNPSSMRS